MHLTTFSPSKNHIQTRNFPATPFKNLNKPTHSPPTTTAEKKSAHAKKIADFF
jgi:hypothetical protein